MLTCPVVALPDDLELGHHWALVHDLSVPGSPGVTAAAVGEQGTVLMAAVAETGTLHARGGQLYCGDSWLEPVVLELAQASKALAEDLPPAPGSAAAVHALLIVPNARVAVAHRDVIITSAEGVADALYTLPAVHAAEEVRAAKSVLRGLSTPPVHRARSDQAAAPLPGPGTAGPKGDGGWLSTFASTSRSKLAKGRLSRLANTRLFKLADGRLSKLAGGRWSTLSGGARGNGRRRARAVLPSLVVLAVVAAVAAGAWYAYGLPGSASQAPSPGGLADALAGTASYATATAYPGQQAGDVLAAPTGAADVGGVQVALGPAVVAPGLVGQMLLCVPLSVDNTRTSAVPAGAVTWSMRSPTGVVDHPASMGDNQLLSAGDVVPGDRVSGRLCFNEPGQPGLYVITFRPPSVGATPPRGVWLLHLSRHGSR